MSRSRSLAACTGCWLPDGAGKSTLMRTLAALQDPDTGSAWFGDEVLRQKKEVRRLGYLPRAFGVYPRISAQDMLDHIALLNGMDNSRERNERVAAMLRRCNLYDVRKKSFASSAAVCGSVWHRAGAHWRPAIAHRG